MNFAKLENTWYGAFQQILMENVEKSNISKLLENVSFITFNYDRCIEHFLVHSITNYYGAPFHEVSALVNRVVIRHPYGVAGLLPWQVQTQRVRAVPFGQVQNADLLEIARQINTFTEQQEDNQKLTAIRRTVQEAEVIVFLGFAFHERNMELLSPGDSYRAMKIYLTRKGISDSDMQVVIKSINSKLRSGVNQNNFLVGVDPDVFPFNSTCAGLFNECWRSLAS